MMQGTYDTTPDREHELGEVVQMRETVLFPSLLALDPLLDTRLLRTVVQHCLASNHVQGLW
jgi:hypothetical protein